MNDGRHRRALVELLVGQADSIQSGAILESEVRDVEEFDPIVDLVRHVG